MKDFVYLIEIEKMLVKIGRSTRPDQRVLSRKSESEDSL